MNVILHALEHVPPFRDYFLREENYAHILPPPGDHTFILGKHGKLDRRVGVVIVHGKSCLMKCWIGSGLCIMYDRRQN